MGQLQWLNGKPSRGSILCTLHDSSPAWRNGGNKRPVASTGDGVRSRHAHRQKLNVDDACDQSCDPFSFVSSLLHVLSLSTYLTKAPRYLVSGIWQISQVQKDIG
jgi:hypothetical protein